MIHTIFERKFEALPYDPDSWDTLVEGITEEYRQALYVEYGGVGLSMRILDAIWYRAYTKRLVRSSVKAVEEKFAELTAFAIDVLRINAGYDVL